MRHRSRKEIAIRIAGLALTHPVWMGSAALLSVISTICWFGPLLVLYEMTGMLFGASGQGARVLSGTYAGNAGGLLSALRAGEGPSILALGFAALVCSVLNVLCYYGALICSHVASFKTTKELRLAFAEHIGRIPLGESIRIGSGCLYEVMESHVGRIQSFLSHEITEMIRGIIYPAALGVLVLAVDFRLGLSLAAGLAVAYVFHAMSMGRGGVKNEMELYLDALDRMNAASIALVRGVPVLKLFGRAGHPLRAFEQSVSDYTGMTIPYTRKWEKYMCWYEALMKHMYLFLLPCGIPMLVRSADPVRTAVTLVFYFLLSVHITSVLPATGGLMHAVMEVIYDIDRVDEILSIPEQSDSGSRTVPERFDVEFCHVSFSYGGAGSAAAEPAASAEPAADGGTVAEEDGIETRFAALKDLSFTAPQGKVTALVGPSGGGKSTAASLLARFWDCSGGSVRIGGTDIRELSFADLMNCTAYVFQDDTLFSKSIADNIRMGRPDASEEEIIAAAKAAAVDDVIRRLKKGYDTVYGEGGMRLSGGEVQRILIARAILKNAPVLVLDEATAFCDAESADLIGKALQSLMKDKTVIMIAHRPESMRMADRILYIENGTVKESGTHEELMRLNGAYAAMLRSGDAAGAGRGAV